MEKITNILAKSKYIELETTKSTYKISEDSYFEGKYKIHQKLSQEDLDLLRSAELYHSAYLRVLNRISYKDRTSQEIREFLMKEYSLKSSEIESIIERLEKLAYLNDEEYLNNYIDLYDGRGHSHNRIVKDLEKKGFNQDDILRKFPYNKESEFKKAWDEAQKILRSNQHKNHYKKIESLKNRLYYRAFSYDTINSVIEDLDLKKDEKKEQEFIKKDYDKLYRRYQRKHQGYELRSRIMAGLASRGYSRDDINNVIDKMGEENEENIY